MKYNHVQHIFFDLDHTLWDFDRNSEKTFEVILQPLFPELSIHDFVKIYNPINQRYWKLYQLDKITHEELRYKRLKETFDILDILISDQLIYEISEDYVNCLTNNNYLIEGCVEVLQYLYPKYKLHIITNGFKEVQLKKMRNSNLYRFFDTITNSELAGVKKPDKMIYQYALDKAKARKEESIMIGDCVQADVEGALNFGIEAIFFNPNYQQVEGKINQINTLIELKNIF
ncbi:MULTISPECIES: YjjG family noncanonical pyrimidine nucleotidase [Flavobacterium]|uniref:YjjG family noncanonical pyrimidine nucleotidase n=1 Tax=Flavobacterium covae TaxID=2906076 RepID=A0ABW8PCN0_9FLAO|nr:MULTISPECIES: YjjG family noncanonical pyrimidine nucleotidase [Flavobacterium]OXA82350.1 noncanonical pyrimidine nucleotidase, YjjG family [Flavobacterium columnare NBRC 100251 = ATCC 23463]AMA49922.1 haloacid dehalogenase [Flavobacterium covae]MCJ1807353.1 YjjG family noncanonical pyrimidine nucleotidase [Flavobacterium covae]MCJ1808089.1 YjjG family noncanonical pyrimidine nucleotidase [Flavobacterium covae]OWP80192.1 noncanonical pyrimidine nucleotidase, YjjG family [Flavobacterium cova